jgi:hypothetical protein
MKITLFFNDLIDLMSVQSKNIEHYKQYSIAPIFFIHLLLVVPSTLLLGDPEVSFNSELTIHLILTFVFTFINAIFFMYWFGRVNIHYSFLTFLNFEILISIAANIPFIAIAFLMDIFDSYPLMGFIAGIGAIMYVIYMFSLNLAKATGSIEKYAFAAIMISVFYQLIPEYILL